MSDSDEDLPGTIHQRQVITQADVSDDDLDDAGVFLAKGQARKAALEEQQRKREEAKREEEARKAAAQAEREAKRLQREAEAEREKGLRHMLKLRRRAGEAQGQG